MAYNPDSFAHKAERKGVELLVDAAIKHTNKDRQKAMMQFIDLAQKFIGDTWDPAAYDRMRDAIATTDTKWYKYISGLFDDITPKQMKALAVNVGYEAGIRGYKQTRQMAEKYNCNVPWVILMDPTSACNLRCTGCWAAEYGHTLALTYEELESIVKQGRELGIHAYVMTGGEPMMRKKNIIRLAEEFQDCYFLFYTNGTLIDEEFCKEMVRVGNVSPNISIEGFEEANDSRRGKGTFDKIMHAMDLMKEYKCLFGASICYTSVNYKVVTSDEFLDMLIEKGCKMLWYFHYMPVGCGASTDLLLTPEEREYMIQRVRWIRGYHTGKPIMAIDFQNDGEYIHGCIAGGKYYLHINPNGDVEPCVFIHYSSANIKNQTLLEALQQPLFMEYRKNQPFNHNYLQPCPMLENPEKLRAMVKASGAKSTDMEAPEDVDALCDKCEDYAKKWAPVAEKQWEEKHFTRSDGKEEGSMQAVK